MSIFLKPAAILFFAAIGAIGFCNASDGNDLPDDRPNFLFCIADDWGHPHASAYGDPVVKTPNFDRIARAGVLFNHAYVSSPSCTPSRSAILTGQYHWRLDSAANLWSVFPDRFVTYHDILEKAGYQSGCTGKAWGPGKTETKGRTLTGGRFKSFEEFLNQSDSSKPFCFWLGTSDPHRPYKPGSGVESGIDLSKIKVPACFPDSKVIRGDIADYYFEVQRFDRLVGTALKLLENNGQLKNTFVVMTGDHGMPFPRCKSNLYDSGARVPLAMMWLGNHNPGRKIDEFVSLIDIGPTFLQAAGIAIPNDMTGQSLLSLLNSDGDKDPDFDRSSVVFGKERHVPSQEKPDYGGYPSRAIRTADFLLIRNYEPDRWPNGTPHYEKATIPNAWYADTDNGPTKSYMIEHQEHDAAHQKAYDLSFAKRPPLELYDLSRDPDQLENVAANRKYSSDLRRMSELLDEKLRSTADPRVIGGAEKFDTFPYFGSGPRFPGAKKRVK